jgi:TolA-binding protein
MKRLVVVLLAACSGSTPSAPEPVEPLVIGKSPPAKPIEVVEGAPEQLADLPATATLTGRDSRRSVRTPRARALVATEVQALEQLLAATRQGAPDRPQILRRLAESYVELARGAAGDTALSNRSSSEALARYQTLLDESPQYTLADEVRYYMALESERLRDFRGARMKYYEIIQKHPNSKHVPGAYFAFGELFFDEAKSDPTKNELAAQAFLQVLKYPAPANGLFPDALLRLVQTYERMGEHGKAAPYARRLRQEFASSDAAAQLGLPTP